VEECSRPGFGHGETSKFARNLAAKPCGPIRRAGTSSLVAINDLSDPFIAGLHFLLYIVAAHNLLWCR
jgi:hypothetical protein